MATIINLYAGPGTGKSTSAAYLYYQAKAAGINAELVREYVKDWAWEGRHVGPFDQFYFLGKQIRKESLLYPKVDFIVTDSPVWMSGFYAWKFTDYHTAIMDACKAYYQLCEAKGHKHIHVFLKRTKKYNPSGRYQSETEAKEIDRDMQRYLVHGKIDQLLTSGTNETSLNKLFKQVIKAK